MRLIRLALPLLAVLTALLAAAPVAAANTYFVYACKTQRGLPAPIDGLTMTSNTPGALLYDNCSSGGSLVASLNGWTQQAPNARAAWHYTAPPNTEIRQFDVWRWGQAVSAASDGGSEPAQYISHPGPDFLVDRREWCNANVCNMRGVETNDLDIRNSFYSGQLTGVRDIYFGATCASHNGYACEARTVGSRPMAQIQIQGLQIMLVDDAVPSATAPTGELVGAGPHKGTESMSFNATDQGAGLYWTLVEIKKADEADWTVVKRKIVDANGGRCAELDGFNWTPYEFGYGQPCRLSASVELNWDTTSTPDGKYQLRVRVEDGAGNATSVSPAHAFEIDNVPASSTTPPTASPSPSPGQNTGGGGFNNPPSTGGGTGQTEDRGELNGSNASDRARIEVSGGARRKLAFGRGASTVVSLRDEDGRPIAGAVVAVLQRMSVPGARWVPVRAPLVTDERGRFTYAIEPRFSRKLRFAYKSHTGDQKFVSQRTLEVVVRSRTSLRTDRSRLRNGETVMFMGRLASRPVPRNGVVIDLQAQVGSRWQTFETLRTNDAGKWKASYRFRSTTGLQTYVFRARVRGDSGYPYTPSVSRRVKVRVQG